MAQSVDLSLAIQRSEVRILPSGKFVLNVYCQPYGKYENNEKEVGNGPFFKIKFQRILTMILLKIKHCG